MNGIGKTLKMTEIKSLIMDGISGVIIQNFVMENFRAGLIATKTLEYLDLSMTLMDNLHIAIEGLKDNKSLKHLNLTSCKLPTHAITYIA